MKIVWDEPKRQQNLAKHGLDFAALTVEFFEAAQIEAAKQDRFLALGELDGVAVIAVVFRRWDWRPFPLFPCGEQA